MDAIQFVIGLVITVITSVVSLLIANNYFLDRKVSDQIDKIEKRTAEEVKAIKESLFQWVSQVKTDLDQRLSNLESFRDSALARQEQFDIQLRDISQAAQLNQAHLKERVDNLDVVSRERYTAIESSVNNSLNEFRKDLREAIQTLVRTLEKHGEDLRSYSLELARHIGDDGKPKIS